MERFSLFLVYWATMCLLVHSHNVRPANSLWTLYFKEMCIRVRPTGEIIGKRASPTIYNLLKEKFFVDKSKNATELRFSLEAIATGSIICMNRTGGFYTLEDKIWKRQERRRVGRAEKILLPPEDCLFKSVDFHSNHTYVRAVGIYSAAHSNTTVGKFISFTSIGTPRSYGKSFGELHQNKRIRINLTPVRHLQEMLNKTIFGRDNELNKRIRKCIRNEGAPFHLRKLRHSSLKRIVLKCKRRAQRKQRAKRGKTNVRRSMKQDSKQRHERSQP